MSNLIKGYSISYDEPTKKLDMNERAESFRKLYIEELEKRQAGAEEQDVATDVHPSTSFTEGLPGERIVIAGSEEETLSEQEKKILENQRQIRELEAKLEELRVQAGQMLDEAEEQAEKIIEDAKQQAEVEAQQLTEDYIRKGYEEGHVQAEQECSALKAELEQKIKQTEEDYEKQVSELEPAFVEILIKYVEKLTGIYAGERPEVIMHVIHQAMTKQTTCRNFIIRVSPQDYGNVINQKPEINLWLPEGSQVEVVEDKMLKEGGCLIETDTRIFDCSIETQLRSLKEDLRLLAGDTESSE